MKKGLLEACVLTALKKEDSYGYKIIGDLSEYIEISESTLYPILKRLEGNGCLTTYSQAHNGRLRKYYKITEEGVRRLGEFAGDWPQLKRIYCYILGEDAL
ncbi:transcriptional regulator, PadR family [Bittarella massiliensis (ex Durand et al. 2017)]|nr:PadR family transcriptional regulator [Bittarella massiliensis (ex Durand et al. 2017)]ERI99391.1 transcriptional regulator, PadR family [Clostridium sp. ATCC 29733]SHF71815.1 transcriptional regulator, PadR family [Bittarella massiliensis (ex Durand et al. 2017)]